MTSNKSAQTARRLYKKIMNVVPRHEKYYPFQQTTNFGLSLISYPRNLPPLSLSSSLSLSLSPCQTTLDSILLRKALVFRMKSQWLSVFTLISIRLSASLGTNSSFLFSVFLLFLILSWSKLSNFVMLLLFGLEVCMTLVFFLNSFLILDKICFQNDNLYVYHDQSNRR